MIDADNTMEMELGEKASDIEPNSDAYKRNKADKKKPEFTITVKQKTFGQKLKEAVFGEDVKNVPEHVFFNIVVPNVMRMFGDSIQGALSMTFRGIGGNRYRDDDDSPYKSYGRMYDRNRERVRRQAASEADFDDCIFNNRAGVEYVISELEELLDHYDVVTVADVCTQLGRTPRAIDNKWGWKSVRDFDVVRVQNGYILATPKPKYLD